MQFGFNEVLCHIKYLHYNSSSVARLKLFFLPHVPGSVMGLRWVNLASLGLRDEGSIFGSVLTTVIKSFNHTKVENQVENNVLPATTISVVSLLVHNGGYTLT